MEAIVHFFAEALLPSASRDARRRRAESFATSLGLRFHAEGAPPDPEASGHLEELEMLGLRCTRPVADTFAGPYQGRHVIGFENPVWEQRRHTPYRFTAVRLRRSAPDLLVTSSKATDAAGPWFRRGGSLPVPVPRDAGRTATAADPSAAGDLLTALADAGESPLARSWTVRENWAVGWRRGRLRPREEGDRLRFLIAAAALLDRA
jgi:hypothetical protein